MVQEHGKRKHKTLTQHKPEEAGSKVVLMYSDQHTVEVRKLQNYWGKGGISRATICENNQKPCSFRSCAL